MAEAARTGAAFWAERLAPFKTASDMRGWREVAITFPPFVLGWYVMLRSLEVHYLLTLALAPLTACFLIRLFVLQHDAGHGALFRSDRLNRLVGTAIGVLTFTPYAYWRRTHAIHHATSGNLDRREFGDIETLTVEEYKALSPTEQRNYRIFRNPFFFLVVGSLGQFLVKHRYPGDIPDTWRKEWRSVWVTNFALVALIGGLCALVGPWRFLAVQVPLVAIAGPVGVWLFYIQHQYDGAYWRRDDEWNYHEAAVEGSSYYDLPQWMHWVSGNIGFHHIHHLDSRVPFYRLQEAFHAVPELQDAHPMGLFESFGAVNLKLWDEDQGKLVGFDAVPPDALPGGPEVDDVGVAEAAG